MTNRQNYSIFPTHSDWSWDPESGSNPNYITPLWLSQNIFCHCKDACYISERLYTEAKGSFVFIEFNILIFILICRQKRTYLNPGPTPALQPAPQPQPAPRRRKKPPNLWVMTWILQRQEKGCYNSFPADLIHTDIQ